MSAYVHISFHRTVGRVAPHVRYIADRPESRGLRGLGPEFRALRGDVERSIALLHEHARAVRTRTGAGLRDGPFVRLMFTLPDDLARRVVRADGALPKGGERVMQDALEATFRSAARHLQGVYALHFHAAQRDAHPHAHVDLSPLDLHGRTVFLTERQRDELRHTWEREVERALDRAERRERPDIVPPMEPEPGRTSPAERHAVGGGRPATGRERAGRGAGEWLGQDPADDLRPGWTRGRSRAMGARDEEGAVETRATLDGNADRPLRTARRPAPVSRPGGADGLGEPLRRRRRAPYLAVAMDRLLGSSGSPLLDLLGRALLARLDARLNLPLPSRVARYAFDLPVRLPRELEPVRLPIIRLSIFPER